MRLFIAVDLPPLTVPASSPRAPERHLTLRFLGETPPERIVPLRGAILRAAAGVVEFPMAIGGGGAFPEGTRPRVVWAGVTEGRDRLLELEHRLAEELAAAGSPEERPFVPHVTILRVRGAVGSGVARRVLDELQDRELGRTVVREIVLYESRLGPEGAEHRPLARAPLRARGPDAASAPSQ